MGHSRTYAQTVFSQQLLGAKIPGKRILAPVRGQTQKGIALCYAMKTQKRNHPSRNA